MVYSADVRTFTSKNHNEIKAIVTDICNKWDIKCAPVEDISQNICLKMITSNNYNPDFKGFENKKSSISTYVYKAARNSIISFKKDSKKMKKVDLCSVDEDSADDAEQSLIQKEMASEFKNIMNYNENADDLTKEFTDFKNFIKGSKKYNKVWTLKKSRGARLNKERKSISVLKMWDYLNYGYSFRQIAENYGTSPKFIGDVMEIIREAYFEFQKK